MLNVAVTFSSVIAVKTAPQVLFGPPMDFLRGGRTEPNPSSNRRAADAMPDGEHVVGLTVTGASDPGADSQIRVVLNWFDELRARVPAR